MVFALLYILLIHLFNLIAECNAYSTSYEKIDGMNFHPGYPHMTWEPTRYGSSIDGPECQTFCSEKLEFTCVAVYRRPGYCFATWIRVEEDINLYSQYYTNDTQFTEYIRKCL